MPFFPIKTCLIFFNLYLLSLSFKNISEQVIAKQHLMTGNSQIYSVSIQQNGAQLNQEYCQGACLICDHFNPNICYSCLVGFALTTQGICVECMLGCVTCSSQYTCTQCYVGYDLVKKGSLMICIQCNTGCQQCQILPFTTGYLIEVSTCITCFAGFYLTASTGPFPLSECAPCIPACYSCSDTTYCLKCVAGYGYNSSANACFICGQNCEACHLQGCIQCIVGFYIQIIDQTSNSTYTTCAQCMQNCLACTSSVYCESCIHGYYVIKYSTKNTTLSKCAPCQPPCIACYSPSICLACNGSYYLQVTLANSTNLTQSQVQSAVCKQCLPNCVICTNSSVCLNCLDGYFINEQTLCQQCTPPCQSCFNISTQCTSCIKQYYSDRYQCKLCGEMCELCMPIYIYQSDAVTSICVKCIQETYAPAGEKCSLCTQVAEGCLTCLSPQRCLTCIDGYYLAETICIQNPQGIAAVYIILICIAGLIGVGAIGFAIWACWRYRNGYGIGSERIGDPGVRASYYQIP